MKDGELMLVTGEAVSAEELTNSAGAIARRGASSLAVFFNLFSETEPFSFDCSRSPCLLGGLLRPEGPKFKADVWCAVKKKLLTHSLFV